MQYATQICHVIVYALSFETFNYMCNEWMNTAISNKTL